MADRAALEQPHSVSAVAEDTSVQQPAQHELEQLQTHVHQMQCQLVQSYRSIRGRQQRQANCCEAPLE